MYDHVPNPTVTPSCTTHRSCFLPDVWLPWLWVIPHHGCGSCGCWRDVARSYGDGLFLARYRCALRGFCWVLLLNSAAVKSMYSHRLQGVPPLSCTSLGRGYVWATQTDFVLAQPSGAELRRPFMHLRSQTNQICPATNLWNLWNPMSSWPHFDLEQYTSPRHRKTARHKTYWKGWHENCRKVWMVWVVRNPRFR